MKLFKAILPSNPRFQEIEFSLLLGWALLFPAKLSYLYFLGFIFLLVFVLLRKIVELKNIVVSRFSFFLLALNALFVFSAFFSPHPVKSVLFVSDVFLTSLWFLFFYVEKSDMERYLRLAAFWITVSSAAVIVFFALQGGRLPVTPVFKNPILQAVASALAVLVFLHALLRKFNRLDMLLLVLNAGAVIISASKAAFLGLALFAAAMILARNRKWLFYLIAALALLVLLPNPMRRMVEHSLRHDPYVLNRLDIWRMSARMFRGHFWTGVGPDLFAAAAKQYNFPQENGPARYFKLPESAHSDYWKVITENGLPGLIFVFLGLFFAIRWLLSPPWFPLPKLLLAFLLVQMLLINLVFNFFFLLLFLLLAQDFLSERRSFVSLQPGFRVSVAGLLVFAALILYLFPFLSDRCLAAAAGEKDFIRRYALLNRAALFSPLDEKPPLARARMLRAFAATRASLDAWTDALQNLLLAQKKDGYGTTALILESALFADLAADPSGYPALGDEILAPLRRAEELDPFNPFLVLRGAGVLRRFGRIPEARRQAQAALGLEPDYVAALLFIHDLDGLPADDPALRERLARIRAKAASLRAAPGTYLFQLHQLPGPGAAGN